MLYAVVDIETTGGYAAAHGITEIAIYIHNGEEVVDSFETLINPHQPIPMHIQALTGINDDMVADAPDFREVADHIYELLHDKIFVAHNVNFDYSFVRHHLEACGHQLLVKKLCTVRLSRKVFPGLASYSLGKLCKTLNIAINNRHRAAGDAEATATLLGLIVSEDHAGVIADTLKKGSREQVLPPNLLREAIDKLPNTPGVYYFKDEKGKVVYVGKAKQLKKRVCTHFTGHSISQQRQNFLKSIFHIDFVSCGTELMAFILEASEIKKLWPANNRAMKRFEQKYSLYHFEDQNGYIRLGIDKHRKDSHALYSFNYLLEGHELLRKLVEQHSLCEKLCFIQTLKHACTHHANGQCNGACVGEEAPEDYNYRVNQAIKQLQDLLPSFILVDQGRTDDEQSCIWVEKGKFYGMGYISNHVDVNDLESLKSAMEPYPSNDYIMNLVLSYQSRFPAKAIPLTIIQQNSEAIDFTFT
ncbi:exonuclease domain-containing protein [Pedobacter sp. ASV12]|uniref:exonuclease domain-containing protein n=1 Tax=Pedobacter sp. ASV12 TaxID=2795120 RepID=UPI0018ED6552|nr:exonuclease domain-containing protein [Pedobacter sp. ASV12]